MCGIGGKIFFGKRVNTFPELEQMRDRLIHRGPDSQGVWISPDKKVGLVHTRLAVIDLSKAAYQPMNYGHNLMIVFNGEVFNYQEEKRRLMKEKYKFNSNSDTEVILALYKKYGVECLAHLRGQFAFAIYDARNRTVFLARDRFGEKPLKYYYDSDCLIFSSEIKAILSQKEAVKRVDPPAIDDYLTFGYVPAPRTGFKNIFKLRPGSYLLVDLKSGKTQEKRYFQLDWNNKQHFSESEWIRLIQDKLVEAVRLQMISDVPVGAFLSGGTDSSTVVAIMSQIASKPVKTFNISFSEKRYDESDHAERVAKLLGTDHIKLLVRPENIEEFPELVDHFGEPLANSSMIISYLVSKLARQFVTVALVGDGGDEMFAGYDRYLKLSRDVFLEKWRRVIFPLAKIATLPLGNQSSKWQYFRKPVDDYVQRYLTYVNFFSGEDKDGMYQEKWVARIGENYPPEIFEKWAEKCVSSSGEDKILSCDIQYYLADDLLYKADMASMKVGLECRSPFLDHELAQLAASIPFGLKIKDGILKYILKRAAEKWVPTENLYRDKRGFGIPLQEWFMGDFSKIASKYLLDKKSWTKNIVKDSYIKNILRKHSEKEDYAPRLWSLLALEMWYERFFR